MIQSADDLIVAVEQNREPPAPVISEDHESDPSQNFKRHNPYEDQVVQDDHTSDETETPAAVAASTPKPEVEAIGSHETESTEAASQTHDEYGNEVSTPAPKTYTEEEVRDRINAAVRDRLARGNHQQEAPTPQAQQQAQQAGFEYDSNNPESWQVQLKQFVLQTISEKQQQETVNLAHQREAKAQADFESKFFQGMAKFNNFQEVVGDAPITDAMALATRGFNDPAGFVYAAASKHRSDLERISKIPDPYVQVVEMGKLEERMKRVKTATSAAKPVAKHTGDVSRRDPTKQSVDDMIAADAKKRYNR